MTRGFFMQKIAISKMLTIPKKYIIILLAQNDFKTEGRMKKTGIALILIGIFGGIALALYVAGYVMLYGGIVGAIHACEDGVDASSLAGNIIRALLWEFGLLSGFIGVIPFFIGVILLESDGESKNRIKTK
jgi:uncharacterized membrane protein